MSEPTQQWSIYIIAATKFYDTNPNNLAKYLTSTLNDTIQKLASAGATNISTETQTTSCATETRHAVSETVIVKYESPKPIEVSITPYSEF